MSYTAVYQKKGIKPKEVDFAKIGTSIQIQVPPPIIATFKKKVEGADKPIDLSVEFDSAVGKYRMVIKKLPPSDVVIDWTDTGVRYQKDFQKDAVLRAKEEIASWHEAITSYQQELDVVTQKISAAKDLLKEVEANPTDPRLTAEVASLKQTLEGIGAEGREIKHRFDTWYSGPRAGVAPLLKKFNVDQTKLDKADSDAFHLGVMDVSKNSNLVLNAYRINVEGAVEALLARLANSHSVATKSQADALADARASLAAQVQEIETEMGRTLSTMKLDSTVELGKQFKERKGGRFDMIKGNPNDIRARIIAGKNQITSCEGNAALIDKTASRIMKSIPPQFLKDPEIIRLETRMSTSLAKFKKDVDEGKARIVSVNNILDAYLNGAPTRPATAPGSTK